MHKVLSFGADKEFISLYGGYFARHGFELEPFSKNAAASGGAVPILLVMAGVSGKGEEDALYSSMLSEGRPPAIFVLGDTGVSARLKSLMGKARYVLQRNFLKKDLIAALKGCAEVLELRTRAERLGSELKAKNNELSSVLDIGKALASSFELHKVLQKIMERLRAMVNAEAWSVMLADEEDNELVFEAAKGKGGRQARPFRLKTGEGIAGWAAEDREPKLVADASREKRHNKAFDKATGWKTRSVMAVPIMGKGKLLGVMELINKEDPGGFTKEDLSLVTRLIDQTAIAIERSVMYQKMADLVITDDLTKLFNLRYLDRTLEVEIERAMRYSLSVSLIFMDIDYFKKVNDRYGHLVGSKLLVEVSQLMLKSLRRVDIVARYGGDEFVIVLPQTDVEAAKLIAERLRRSVEKNVFLKSENLALRLTASFGIACYPQHAGNKEELIRLADEAMYRVKYQTRNSVYVVGS